MRSLSFTRPISSVTRWLGNAPLPPHTAGVMTHSPHPTRGPPSSPSRSLNSLRSHSLTSDRFARATYSSRAEAASPPPPSSSSSSSSSPSPPHCLAVSFATERSLVGRMSELADIKIIQLSEMKKRHSTASLGDLTVGSTIGGMRGAKALLCDTSMLDPRYGILFRGKSIDEVLSALPRHEGGEGGSEQPMTEGLLWLLLTGKLPSPEEVLILQQELHSRASLPPYVYSVLDSLPLTTHPMTQLISGAAACQPTSRFAVKYREGMRKSDYWRPCLEDALSVIAQVPIIAAYVYRRTFFGDKPPPPRADLDWAGNFSYMMGLEDPEVMDMMRLYLLLHADHEGGNVSAHACHLVGSALSDPWLSFSAAMTGLAGPLHGLANQECLTWLKEVEAQLDGAEPTGERIASIARETLERGRVIPGYGHAALRIVDPRFTAQREFAMKKMPNDRLFKLLDVCYHTIPSVLKASGKVANPYPNVDCHSGVILSHYNITQANYYTVLFGVSRSIGVMSQLVWSRIYGLPIERPNSLTLDRVEDLVSHSP